MNHSIITAGADFGPVKEKRIDIWPQVVGGDPMVSVNVWSPTARAEELQFFLRMDPKQARETAAALILAADYAERQAR